MNAVMNNVPGERAQLLPYVAALDIAEAQARWASDAVNGPIAQKMTPEPRPEGALFDVPDATVRALLVQAGWRERDVVIAPDAVSLAVRGVTPEDARTAKLAALKTLRDAIQYDAFLYDGHWIDCDHNSRANLTGFQLSLVSGTDPFPYQWRSADNVWLALPDRVTWAALIDAFDSHVKAAWTAFAAHEAAIAVHADPASYDITPGAWPPTRIDKSTF